MTNVSCFSRRRFPLGRLPAMTLAALALANAPSVRALNFELRHMHSMDDGQMTDHTYFQYDEHTDVSLDLPRNWQTSSSAGFVLSTPPDRSSDQFRLEKSALAPDTPFQDKGLEVYRQRVLAAVPQGAQNIHLVSEQADPLPLFGWKDYEFVVDYDFYGQTVRRGTMYINVGAKVQLVMTTAATPRTFADMRTASFRVMRTWCVVPGEAGSNPVK